MTLIKSIKVTFGNQTNISSENDTFKQYRLEIPIQCPFCLSNNSPVGTWGTYKTKIDSRTRFKCKICPKTFNFAKNPWLKNKLPELIWNLAQLVINDRITLHSLSQKWNIPETTLTRLNNEIKQTLADNFEQAKQLQNMLNSPKESNLNQYRVIAYDEGFLKLMGLTGYLLFVLDSEGKPLTLKIESDRSAETIHSHFLSALTQLGGIDVIIADAAAPILSAARALRRDLILVQHVHSRGSKLARIRKIKTIPNRKKITETTIELNTGSLLPNTESIIAVSKKQLYPRNFSGTPKVNKNNNSNQIVSQSNIERVEVLSPESSIRNSSKTKKQSPKLIKGEKVHLITGSSPGFFELGYLDPIRESISEIFPTLPEIHGMLLIIQSVFPHQFITSNRAEVFNAVHDHFQAYLGVKTFENANRDLKAWAVLKYFPDSAKRLIRSHQWHVPYSILKKLSLFLISEVKLP